MVNELPLASPPSSAANGGGGGGAIINRGSSEECRGNNNNTGATHTNMTVLVAHLNDQTIYTQLQKNDVLLGRGTGPNEYEGNVRFRKMIKDILLQSVVDPKELSTKKTTLARLVVNQVASRGGRFLRKLSKEETSVALKRMFKDEGTTTRPAAGFLTRNRGDFYVEVSKSVAVEKTKQSIRHQRRMTQQEQEVARIDHAAGFHTEQSSISGTTTRRMLTKSNKNKNAAVRPPAVAASSILLGDKDHIGSSTTSRSSSTRNCRWGRGQGADEHDATTILHSAASAAVAVGECGANDGAGGANKKKTITIGNEDSSRARSSGATSGTSAVVGNAPPLFSLTAGGINHHLLPQLQHLFNPGSHGLFLSGSSLMPSTASRAGAALLLPASARGLLLREQSPLPRPVSFLNPSTSRSYFPQASVHGAAVASTQSSLAALVRAARTVSSSSEAIDDLVTGEPAHAGARTTAFEQHTMALQQLLRSSSSALPPACGTPIVPSWAVLGRSIDSLISPRLAPSSAAPGGRPDAATSLGNAEQEHIALFNYLLGSAKNNSFHF